MVHFVGVGLWVHVIDCDGGFSDVGKCANFGDAFWKACMVGSTNELALFFPFSFPIIKE